MIQREAGLDFELHFVLGAVLAGPVPVEDAQARDDPAALEMEQGPRELAAVIGLLVAKIVGAEQFAGGVVQPVGVYARHERIGNAFHGGEGCKGPVTIGPVGVMPPGITGPVRPMLTTTSSGWLDRPSLVTTTSRKRYVPTGNPRSTTTVGVVVVTGLFGENVMPDYWMRVQTYEAIVPPPTSDDSMPLSVKSVREGYRPRGADDRRRRLRVGDEEAGLDWLRAVTRVVHDLQLEGVGADLHRIGRIDHDDQGRVRRRRLRSVRSPSVWLMGFSACAAILSGLSRWADV